MKNESCIGSVRIVDLDMANERRLTFNPSLTEAEFTRFCAANPDLRIAQDPSGVITVKRQCKGRDDCGDWQLSQRETVSSEIDLQDDEALSVRREVHPNAEDIDNLQALQALQGWLIRERETSEGAHATALNVAIRAMVSQTDILESLIAHALGMPPKMTGRDTDTYEQRRKFLTDTGQPAEKTHELSGRDPAGRIVAEESVAASQIISAFIANSPTHELGLSNRDIQVLLEMIKHPPAPSESLRQAVRQYLTAIADLPTSDTKSISEIIDTE